MGHIASRRLFEPREESNEYFPELMLVEKYNKPIGVVSYDVAEYRKHVLHRPHLGFLHQDHNLSGQLFRRRNNR